jgi:hypothetical protein
VNLTLSHPTLGTLRALVARVPSPEAIDGLNADLDRLPEVEHEGAIRQWIAQYQEPAMFAPSDPPPPVLEIDVPALIAECEELRARLNTANELLGAVKPLVGLSIEIVNLHKIEGGVARLHNTMMQRDQAARALPEWVGLWAMGEVAE